MSGGDRLLQARAATVRFAGERPAVDGADLSLACGEITALLGPSGSGKSTLLRAIAGLERLDAGDIRFAGEIWSGEGVHREPEMRRCGVVFQDYALFPHLTAVDNAAFALNRLPRRERRRRALARLETVELAERAFAYPHELSGGEQQRVALARALAVDPDVMLLDEPFSGLDRRLRGELRETTAKALRESGAATLIVTHDAEEAMALADTVALMNAGSIIQTGPPDRLYLEPASETAARLLGDVEAFDAIVLRGRAETPLGPVETAAREGGRVRVLVRPEGVIVDDAATEGAPADVIARRPAGADARLVCRLSTGPEIAARVPITHPARPGDTVSLRLDATFAAAIMHDT